MVSPENESTPGRRAKLNISFLPIIQWLSGYNWKQWIRADIIAGITLWGVAVPENIAYARLAGLPAQAGLYTLLAAPVLYAIFGTSNQLVVLATSASAVMLASTVAALNLPDQSTYVTLAAALVLTVGTILILAGILRLGFITNFISRPVMEGFIFGLAIFIVVKQLPKIIGIERGEGNSFHQLGYLVTHLGETRWLVLIIGIGALTLLFIIHRLFKRIPVGLLILALGIIASNVFNLSSMGVSVVGVIPSGLPSVVVPQVGLNDLWLLLPGALGLALVIFSEGSGAYSDIRRNPENKTIPGLLIFRFNSPIYFANASLFHSKIKELISISQQPVKGIIVDMITNDRLDITSIEMLEKLSGELRNNNILMMATNVHKPILETVYRSGLVENLNQARVFPTIDAAVQEYLKQYPIVSASCG